MSLPCSGENQEEGFKQYHNFPFSIGLEYNSLFPLTVNHDLEYKFSTFDVRANLIIPLAFLPQFQSSILLGLTQTLGTALSPPPPGTVQDNDQWDHTGFYMGTGLIFSHIFSKYIQAGLTTNIGISYTRFPNRFPGEGVKMNYDLYTGAGINITINPIYNLSIDLSPEVRYQQSLNKMNYFDGWSLMLGGSINFRAGDDPEIVNRILRSIKFEQLKVNTLFAAMQSYYIKNPVGEITIVNTEKGAITDVKVSFFQAGFMDSPTPSADIKSLKPGERRKISLYASFNSEIFNREGITPLTGDVIISYSYKKKHGEQSTSQVYDLYDKSSLTWDDDKKVAAFITPADSVVRNWASYTRQSSKEVTLPALNSPLQAAVQIYSGLDELGCLYQVDPQSPFPAVYKDKMAVDSISLPRETLSRITGDCDDLTVLYLSLLESMGIETAFITIPGHIFPAFNTRMKVRDYKRLNPDRSMLINIKGELWIPVEITLVGQTGFLEAWQVGIEQFLKWGAKAGERGFYLSREAQIIYRPVGLKKREADFDFGDKTNIAKKSKANLDAVAKIIIEYYQNTAEKTNNKRDFHQAGIVLAGLNRLTDAETAFNRALEIDPGYTRAKINLGNLYFQDHRYLDALEAFENILAALDPGNPAQEGLYAKTLLRISLIHYQLKNYLKSKELYQKLNELSPEISGSYSFLDNDDDTRAVLPKINNLLDFLNPATMYLEDIDDMMYK